MKCPKCKSSLSVPAAKTSSKTSKSGAAKIAVQCVCGQKFAAKSELAGKKVKCPGCGEPVLIKSTSSGKTKAKSKPQGDIGGLFDEIGFNPDDGSAAKKCPECRASMRGEAIVCIDCGYNETTGKKMQTYRPVTQDERKKRLEKEDKVVAGAKGSGKKSNSTTIAVVAIVAVAAAVIWYFLMGPGTPTT